MNGKMEIEYSRDRIMAKIEGSSMEAAFMLCDTIRRVYFTIRKSNPKLAETFKDICRVGLGEDSPLWRSPEDAGVEVFMKMGGRNDAGN